MGEVAGGAVIVVAGAVCEAAVFNHSYVVGVAAGICKTAVQRIITHAGTAAVIRVYAILAGAELSDRYVAHLARGDRRDPII